MSVAGDEFLISFIYIRNSTGPSTDPWGTPQFTNDMSDLAAPSTVY